LQLSLEVPASIERKTSLVFFRALFDDVFLCVFMRASFYVKGSFRWKVYVFRVVTDVIALIKKEEESIERINFKSKFNTINNSTLTRQQKDFV
jgi:hypothetical protein